MLKNPKMFDDLSQYRATVRRLAILKDGTIFLNSGPAHAAIVMRELLNQAENSVRIVSGILSEKVFDIHSFYEMKLRGITKDNITILLTEPECQHSDLAKNLAREDLATVLFREDGSDFHFASVDRKHFRWENDVEGMSASFGFGAEAQSEKIDDLCQLLSETAIPLIAQSKFSQISAQ